jgi:putative Mg2+ transporter-C (MgtC) family protein
MFESDLNILLRVLIIAVLAGFLGWERESAGKPAGLRTHILVGIAAVLFVAVGELMLLRFQIYGAALRFDAANLVGAVVTGISFLGAGMIFLSRGSGSVKGLTTAAGILTTAAIGMLVGLERYFVAVGSTAIVFVVLRFVSMFETSFLEKGGDEESDKKKGEDA